MKTQRSIDPLCRRLLAVFGLALVPVLAARADYTNTVINDHPVAFYPINATVDPNSTTATDLSGNGNNGQYVSNDPQFNSVPGPTAYLPSALAFDGVSSYVDLSSIANPGLLNFSGTITMEAWVQPANSTEVPADILAKGDDSSQNYNEVALRANGGNFYGGSFNFTNGSGNVSGGVQTTNWSYLVVTYDGTNWNIYQNGQRVNQSASSWGSISFAGNYNIGVGSADAGPFASNPRWFAGNLCYVALYTNALTPAQVLNHFYSAELNAPPATSIPIITVQPQSQAGFINGSITFSVTAVSALATTNQWYKGGSPILNQTNTTLTLNNLQLSDAANYTVRVGSANGITNSAVAVLTVSSGNNLKWHDGGTSGAWDTATTANWLNTATSAQTTFNPGDAVLFDDTPGVSTNISVNDNVSPSVITVNSSTNAYTIGGQAIAGPAALVKLGSSLLTLVTPGNFTGPVTVGGGVLYAGNNCLRSAGAVVVSNNATMDLGGGSFNSGEQVTIAGSGTAGQGALINSYPDGPGENFNATLAGDTVFGGTQRWDWDGGSLTGAHKLAVSWSDTNGYGEWNSVTINASAGDLSVATGKLGIKSMGSTFGNPAANFVVNTNCELDFWSGDAGYAKNYHIYNGAKLQFFAGNQNFPGNTIFDGGNQFVIYGGSGNQLLSGTMVLNGDVHFVLGDANNYVPNVISGSGGFVWDAYNHLLVFAAANTYSGRTVIGGGLTLALTNSGSISHSSTIFFGGGSPGNISLDVSGRTDNTLTLASGQTLGGIGTVNGKLVVSTGATIAPGGTNVILGMTEGSSVTGTLSASNDVTLAGNTVMKVNGSGVSDEIASTTKINYGGTLTVANVSGASFAAGNSFQIFSAPSLTGSFTISPTTPGPGLAWDTTQLNSNGSLNVISTGGIGPIISTNTVVSGNLIFGGSGGVAGNNYVVYATTNLATGPWVPVQTNKFDGSGNFSATNAISVTTPQTFFRIK